MKDAHLDAWITAGTAALGLPVKPAWREAVRTHLRIALDHVDVVLDSQQHDLLDPAPVFRA
jgi:predicted ATPase